MIIVVADVSVIAHLERGLCLEACFRLPGCEFVVPDLLYRRELAESSEPGLCELGLRVETLSGDELSAAQSARRKYPTLSLLDTYAFTLASSRGWSLFTEEGGLQDAAEQDQVRLCGVLWIVDQLYELRVLDGKALALGLTAMSNHPRCRVSRAGIQSRQATFAKPRR